MPARGNAKRFPERLSHSTDGDAYRRMAEGPSWRAPDVSEILAQLYPEAGGELPDLLDRWAAKDCVWDDGKLVGFSLSGRAFLSGFAEIRQLAPVDSVRLVAVQPFMAELAESANLRAVKKLDLRGNWIGADGLQQLLNSRHLDRLESFNLSRNGLAGEGLTALAGSPLCGRLSELDLSDNQLRDEHLPLVSSVLNRCEKLCSINLSANRLGPMLGEMMGELMSGREWAEIRLAETGLSAAGVKHWLRVSPLPAVGRLDLGFNRIGDDGVSLLSARLSGWHIKSLNLAGNRIGSDGMRELSRALEAAEPLAELDLSANLLDDEAVECLAGVALPHLRRLDLRFNPISADGLARLRNSRSLAGVKLLADDTIQPSGS